MKYKEITSEMVNMLRLTNKDNALPRRYIMSLLKDSAAFLISQKWSERGLLGEISLYTEIPCFEFEKVNTKDCPSIEFRLCNTLMKSKKKLPKLIFSRSGAAIKDVISLDGNYEFKMVDENTYRRDKKRKYKLKNEVSLYLGSDYHLYVPDHEIMSLDLKVLTTERRDAENCSECSENNQCESNWEQEFICPDKLLEAVKEMTLQKLGFTKQIREDINPNGVENA